MSMQFYPLVISNLQKEAPDAVSIEFAVPDGWKEIFQFIQGQNITLRAQINGEDVRRSYSICSSPAEGILKVGIRQIPGGVFSTYANSFLKVGDTLDVMPAVGSFNTALDAAKQKNYMAFAAGSGITPLMSIIKATLETEPHSHFTLMYGNRDRQHIMFREALEQIKDRYIARFHLMHVLSRETADNAIQAGRIDAEKCSLIDQKIMPFKKVDVFFLCGPEAMVKALREVLTQYGVPSSSIHVELFHTELANRNELTEKRTLNQGMENQWANLSIKLDGIQSTFSLAYEGQSILQAALQRGIDLPYACKGGMCCTCRAHLDSGEVMMDRNFALSQDELDAGFILTCQSHPRTPAVSVNFDVR